MDLKSDFKKGDDVKILQKEYLKRKPPVYEVSLIMQIYNNYLDKKALQEYILKTDEKHLSNVIKMADVSGIDMELLQEYLLSFNTDKDKALHKYSIIFFLKRAEDKGFSANIKLLQEKYLKIKPSPLDLIEFAEIKGTDTKLLKELLLKHEETWKSDIIKFNVEIEGMNYNEAKEIFLKSNPSPEDFETMYRRHLPPSKYNKSPSPYNKHLSKKDRNKEMAFFEDKFFSSNPTDEHLEKYNFYNKRINPAKYKNLLEILEKAN